MMARRTGLYDEHIALGGRMVEFAGWELPVQYDPTGALQEHRAVREAAGLFDIDHMGQFTVSGPQAQDFLDHLLTANIHEVPLWHAQYSLLPYADGGLVDDVLVYRLPQVWWLIVNAANRPKDLHWLRAHARDFAVTLADISDATYMLALQGPRAQEILQRVTSCDLQTVAFHTVAQAKIVEVPALVAATGYTGEYGYELYLPPDQAVHVWRALLAAGQPEGLLPCGLAARDSLRFEAALPLYGHELGPMIDPFTAGLGSFVDVQKPFIARDALLKIKQEGPARKLVGFAMIEPAVPRADYPVLRAGAVIGHVTTGMKAPTLNKFLGMALVSAQDAAPDTEIDVLVRDKPKRAVIVKRPFYIPAYRRGAQEGERPSP